MFFHFRQNNTGGSFTYDDAKGISITVIIEADDATQANYLAERIGLYFDGSGDCSCCGNRWYEAWGDGDPKPLVYGKSPRRLTKDKKPTVYVHYKTGKNKGKFKGYLEPEFEHATDWRNR